MPRHSMRDRNVPLVSGDEVGAFAWHRHLHPWHHGRLRHVKRSYRRRCRRFAKQLIREEVL